MAKSSKKSNVLRNTLIIVGILLIGFVLGNYYKENNNQAAKQDITTWRSVRFDSCSTTFKVPPKEEPYYYEEDPNAPPSVTDDKGSGRYWDIPRGSIFSSTLNLLTDNYDSVSQMVTMFAAPSEASGYISAAVSVSCMDNVNNLDNKGLLDQLKAEVNRYNTEKEAVGMMPENYTLGEVAEITMWNKSVLVVPLNDTEYYVFATPERVYEIQKEVGSSDAVVQKTAEDILKNLTID